MKTKGFLENLSANIIYALLIAVALLASQLIFKVIDIGDDFSTGVISMFIGTAIIFFPATWMVNKFLVKPDWSSSFAKIVMKQVVLLTIGLLFLVLALISSSIRHVDMAEPILLTFVTVFALAEIKTVVMIMKRKGNKHERKAVS